MGDGYSRVIHTCHRESICARKHTHALTEGLIMVLQLLGMMTLINNAAALAHISYRYYTGVDCDVGKQRLPFPTSLPALLVVRRSKRIMNRGAQDEVEVSDEFVNPHICEKIIIFNEI